jgi:hypothetical protein
LTYACSSDRGIRVTVRRKSHNLDETLLRQARRVLGSKTETATIHDALRAVLVGDAAAADLEAARGKVRFRSEFARKMRGELRQR